MIDGMTTGSVSQIQQIKMMTAEAQRARVRIEERYERVALLLCQAFYMARGGSRQF